MLKTFLEAQRVSAAVLLTAVMGLSACSSSGDSEIIGATPTPLPSASPGPTVVPPPTSEPGTPTPTPTMVVTPTPTPTVTPTPTLVPMVYGIRNGDDVVRFSPTTPGTVTALGSIGVDPATDPIVGLDRRPADGNLYAVSRSGRIFAVTIVDGNFPGILTTEIQSIQPVTLPAGRIGTDFNPAANALRLIGDDGQNFRVPTAALTNPAPATPVNTLVDGIMGYRQGVMSAAYTNPHPETVATPQTELFVVDAEEGALYLQDANAGALAFVANLSADLGAVNGYDIYQGEANAENEHFVVTSAGGEAVLSALDPETGDLSIVATRPGISAVSGLVVIENIPVTSPLPGPPLRALLLDSSGEADVIKSFAFNRTATDIGTPVTTLTIEGLETDERILGIDKRTTSRVANRVDVLYAVTSQSRVVALLEGSGDTLTVSDAAELSRVGPDDGVVPLMLDGEAFGVDFNPAADLLRVVSDTGQNLRVNLQLGREIDGVARPAGFAAVDGTTRVVQPDPTVGLPPQIVATAYRAAPADGSFQFAIDAQNSSLARVVVPNDGALELVGPLGLGLSLPQNADGAAAQSLDIAGPADGTVLAVLMPSGAARSALYAINLDTGAATLIGSIGAADSAPIEAMTVRFE